MKAISRKNKTCTTLRAQILRLRKSWNLGNFIAASLHKKWTTTLADGYPCHSLFGNKSGQ
jgi:hypothetical protein